MRLRACPHDDCLGPVGHRWASHYIPVPETLVEGGFGLLCPDCHRLPDRRYAGVPFPVQYFTLWELAEGAGDTSTTLASGPFTYAAEPNRYRPASDVPPRAALLGISAAADYLQVSDSALRDWSNKGNVRCRMVQSGPGKPHRVYEIADLDRVKAARFVLKWQATYGPTRAEADSDVATLAQVAAWANVGDWHLRPLISMGTLTATTRGDTGRRTSMLSWTQVRGVLTEDWRNRHSLDHLSISDVATLANASPGQVRAATDTRPDGTVELPSLLTDGGTKVFARSDVDAWLAGPGRRFTLLTPQHAIALIGAQSTDVLRAATAAGELPALRTPGGHARYARADLLDWASRTNRGAPTHHQTAS